MFVDIKPVGIDKRGSGEFHIAKNPHILENNGSNDTRVTYLGISPDNKQFNAWGLVHRLRDKYPIKTHQFFDTNTGIFIPKDDPNLNWGTSLLEFEGIEDKIYQFDCRSHRIRNNVGRITHISILELSDDPNQPVFALEDPRVNGFVKTNYRIMNDGGWRFWIVYRPGSHEGLISAYIDCLNQEVNDKDFPLYQKMTNASFR